MSKYAGVVVGGPMAGKLYSGRTKQFHCAVDPKIAECSIMEADEQLPVKFTTVFYQWEPLYGLGGDFGFWRHADMTARDALGQLVDAYQRVHQARIPTERTE